MFKSHTDEGDHRFNSIVGVNYTMLGNTILIIYAAYGVGSVDTVDGRIRLDFVLDGSITGQLVASLLASR